MLSASLNKTFPYFVLLLFFGVCGVFFAVRLSIVGDGFFLFTIHYYYYY